MNRLRDDDHEYAASWFACGRTIDFVCPRCGSAPKDFSEKCSADLADRCPGFVAIDNARLEFEEHWARRIRGKGGR